MKLKIIIYLIFGMICAGCILYTVASQQKIVEENVSSYENSFWSNDDLLMEFSIINNKEGVLLKEFDDSRYFPLKIKDDSCIIETDFKAKFSLLSDSIQVFYKDSGYIFYREELR